MRQIIIQGKLAAFSIFFVLSYSLCLLPAGAEVLCSVDISYKWKRIQKIQPKTTPAVEASSAAEAENTVHFTVIEHRAESQAIGKQGIVPDVNRAKIRASEACKREHQDVASCASMKFQTTAGTLSSLGFSARRELEQTILNDCKAAEGLCTAIEAAEAKCNEVVMSAANVTPTVDPAKAGDKKKKK